jgi:hypothetical protein
LRLGLARDKWRRLGLAGAFAVAMAYAEAAVVAYLRLLYYPDGFLVERAALDAVPRHVLLTEAGREAATIVMLVAVAVLTAKRNWWERLAYFIWAFAVWDIFYYVWLFVLIRWPSNLMTLDVLFLIPVAWVAPVLLPIVASGIFLVTAATILKRT